MNEKFVTNDPKSGSVSHFHSRLRYWRDGSGFNNFSQKTRISKYFLFSSVSLNLCIFLFSFFLRQSYTPSRNPSRHPHIYSLYPLLTWHVVISKHFSFLLFNPLASLNNRDFIKYNRWNRRSFGYFSLLYVTVVCRKIFITAKYSHLLILHNPLNIYRENVPLNEILL